MQKLTAISFPWGGGGNHIRTMLSLDKTFDDCFKQLKVDTPTVENKLKYLRENNYSSQKSWFNWLEVEWNDRPIFDSKLQIMHEYYNWEIRSNATTTDNIHPNSKILFLEYKNIDFLVENYWYINLGLNSCSPSTMKRKILEWQHELEFIKARNFEQCLCLNGELLFQKQLDQNFYNQICDWFGFEKFYTEANTIHQWWQECKERSAKEFCQWFKGQEFQAYLARLENGSLELT